MSAAQQKTQPPNPPALSSPLPRWGLPALLLLHATLLTIAAATNSATFDETAHLPAGCVYWRYGDLSIYNLSPPLLRLWTAWPALLSGVEVPQADKYHTVIAEDRHWLYARDFEIANRAHYTGLYFWPRMTIVLLSCLIVVVIYVWGRELYGPLPALLAAALYALNPDALAHGSLITTDAGLTLTMLLTLWLWQRCCRQPTLRHAALLALAAGAAVLCKHSAIFQWPMMLAMAIPLLWSSPARQRWAAAAAFAGSLLGTLLLVNLAYGFDGSFESWGRQTLLSDTMLNVQRALFHAPTLLPRAFLEGFDGQIHQGQNFVWCYLLGEQYLGSRWYYFPIALALKLPVSVLALGALAIFRFRRPAAPTDRRDQHTAIALAAALFFLLMILFGRINVGVRYLLPLYPLLFLLLAHLWSDAARWSRRAATALLTLAALEMAWVAPQFLCFVNILGGGPSRGFLALNDSNYDWGQDLLRLKRWMDQNQVPSIDLTYFGAVDPAVYGIRHTPGIEGGDEPLVGISAFYLAGMSMGIPLSDTRSLPVKLPLCEQLLRRRPVARPGYSIFIYRREDVMAAYEEFVAEQKAAGTGR